MPSLLFTSNWCYGCGSVGRRIRQPIYPLAVGDRRGDTCRDFGGHGLSGCLKLHALQNDDDSQVWAIDGDDGGLFSGEWEP